MRQVDKKIAELEVAFKSAEYQRAIDLTTMVRDLVKQTKEETLRIKETRKIEEAPPPEDGRYVYCIIPWGGSERRLSFGRIGIEDSGEAYTIPFGDLAVVVSNSPLKEYTPSEDNVLTHNQVIMLVMDRYPVLPMAFGMAFKNEETLKEVLGRIHDDLKKALTEVAGKVEFGVKVIQPKEAEFDEDAFASEIKVLRELAVQCKLGRRFSKRLVLNAFYLVSESSVMAFVSAVNTLQERFSQLKISCTGPWPPFNFVTIKVGRGDQNAVPH
ncbi:MAG: GvpL/GvpF family gas vesicle protein, partial [Crenarchaeota archaeon]|nr:GvpL/GvpF family gas vesicle protein [Thermoproteota archaeon]